MSQFSDCLSRDSCQQTLPGVQVVLRDSQHDPDKRGQRQGARTAQASGGRSPSQAGEFYCHLINNHSWASVCCHGCSVCRRRFSGRSRWRRTRRSTVEARISEDAGYSPPPIVSGTVTSAMLKAVHEMTTLTTESVNPYAQIPSYLWIRLWSCGSLTRLSLPGPILQRSWSSFRSGRSPGLRTPQTLFPSKKFSSTRGSETPSCMSAVTGRAMLTSMLTAQV